MSNSKAREPKVHILMASFQGERFIKEQLESIKGQSYTNWILHISDDGSTDKTLDMVKEFVGYYGLVGQVNLHRGPQKGATQNFLYLVALMRSFVEKENKDALFAFCDQDDVWLEDKIQRAVNFHLKERQKTNEALDRPLLYASLRQWVREDLHTIAQPKCVVKGLSFKNAIVQNSLSGNTMVWNVALLNIIQKVRPDHAVWHDWTAYQLATGCGGRAYLDATITLKYRQHGHNVIGVNQLTALGLIALIKAIKKGRYKSWMELNLLGLHDVWSDLDTVSKNTCLYLERIRSQANPIHRLYLAWVSGLRRQGRVSQISFVLMCMLGCV